LTKAIPGVEDGDPRALHRTRVASRRLREVLPVLQLDPAVTDKMTRRLRKITVRLGGVRELDVLLSLIDELSLVGRYPPGALHRVGVLLSERRIRARARMSEKISVSDLRRVANKLQKLLDTLASKETSVTPRGRAMTARSWHWVLEARVARRAATHAPAIADAGAIYLSERLHAVRIAVKKLRYAVELSAETAGHKTTPDLTELRRAQEVLGRLHDLQMLIDRTREVQGSLTPPDVGAWRELDTLVVALEEDCRRLHGRYLHDSAALEALCVRLGGRRRSSNPRTQKSAGRHK
jgi:CHAD domain-containing protein